MYPASKEALEALSLFKLPFVRRFLLFPDTYSDVTILTNPVQRQASVLLNIHRVMCGVPSFDFEAHSNWLCTPAFSRGTVTVGCIIQNLHLRAAPLLVSSKQKGYSMRRFVLDSATGQLLTVGYPSSEGTIEITFLSFFCTTHPTALVMQFEALNEAIDADLHPRLVRRAILFMFMHCEKRDCPICGVHCVCGLLHSVPMHSLDFSSFGGLCAATVGVYSGFGNQHMVVGGLEPPNSRPMRFQCVLRKIENASRTADMWNWGVTSRFNELPLYPINLAMPQTEIKPLSSNHSIVDELEEHQRASRSSTASLQKVETLLPRLALSQLSYKPTAVDFQISTIPSECATSNQLDPSPYQDSVLKCSVPPMIYHEQTVLPTTNPFDSSARNEALSSMLAQNANQTPLPTVTASGQPAIQNESLVTAARSTATFSSPSYLPIIHAPYRSAIQKRIFLQPLQLEHQSPTFSIHPPSSQPAQLTICEPMTKRNSATPIAVNPSAPAMESCTFVTERDKQLLERKERNRRSAARSNEKRRQAFLELERSLMEENQKMEELIERQNELRRENALLVERTREL